MRKNIYLSYETEDLLEKIKTHEKSKNTSEVITRLIHAHALNLDIYPNFDSNISYTELVQRNLNILTGGKSMMDNQCELLELTNRESFNIDVPKYRQTGFSTILLAIIHALASTRSNFNIVSIQTHHLLQEQLRLISRLGGGIIKGTATKLRFSNGSSIHFTTPKSLENMRAVDDNIDLICMDEYDFFKEVPRFDLIRGKYSTISGTTEFNGNINYILDIYFKTNFPETFIRMDKWRVNFSSDINPQKIIAEMDISHARHEWV